MRSPSLDDILYPMEVNRMSVIDAHIEQFYVTSAWVADHYGVTRMAVHRAVTDGRLHAVRVRSARRDTWLFYVNDLPEEFPNPN